MKKASGPATSCACSWNSRSQRRKNKILGDVMAEMLPILIKNILHIFKEIELVSCTSSKFRTFYSVKDYVKKIKGQTTAWGEMFASYVSATGLVSRIYAEL